MKTKTKKIVAVSISCCLCALISFFIFRHHRSTEKQGLLTEISFKENFFDGGIKAFALPLENHGIAYIKCVFKNAGILHNDLNRYGISNIVASLLFKKVGKLSHEETIEKMKSLGIRQIRIFSQGDDFEISFFVPSEKIKEATDFLNQAFIDPNFSDGDLEVAKERISTAFDLETTSSIDLMTQKIFEMLYADCNYGLNTKGIAQAISGITKADVQNFIKEKLTLSNVKVYCAGNIDNFKQDFRLFDDVARGDSNETQQLSSNSSAKQMEVISKENMQDIVGICHGIRIDDLSDIEKAALFVVTKAIFSDMYFEKGLKQKNIVCDFQTKFIERSLSNTFLIFVYVEKKDCEKYIKYFFDTMKEYADNIPIDEEIFSRIKKGFAIANNNAFCSLDNIDDQFKNYQMPFADVSFADVANIFKKVFGNSQIKTVICGSSNDILKNSTELFK